MPLDHSDPSPESHALGRQKAPRPLQAVVADGDAAKHVRLQGEAAHIAAEEPEKTRADILLAVESEWDYCAQSPKDAETAEAVTDILLAHQKRKQARDPGYVVGADETPAQLEVLVKLGMRRRVRRTREAETVAVKEKETSDLESGAQAYEDWKNAHAGDFVAAVRDARSLPVGEPPSPELVAERAKLMQFQRILTIAQSVNPADHAVISQRMAGLDLGQGTPSVVTFIQTAIFCAPQRPSGVSEATQAAIAAEFKLTPRRIVTGSDFEEAMGETVVDADGNQMPAYRQDAPLKFGVGVEGYASDNGQQMFMKATPEHGQAVTLDVTKLSPAKKAVLASYLDIWRMAEDAGETDFLLSLTQYDIRGGGVIDEIKLIEAAQVVNALYGGFAGYNGEILRGDDKFGMIRWQAQLKSPKGDAGRGDRNASATGDNLRGLRIRDRHGRLDLDVLRVFGEFSRDNWFGAPDYDAVRAHLAKRFPKKFGPKPDHDETT